MENKSYRKIGVAIFVFIEVMIYVTFLVLDFSNVQIGLFSSILKYIGVALCSVFAIIALITAKKLAKDKFLVRNIFILVIAFLLTLVSDYFLLVAGKLYEIGVAIFIFAQLAHMLRFIHLKKKERHFITSTIIFRIVISAYLVFLLLPLKMFTPLNILVAIYFPNLVFNALDCLVGIFKSLNHKRLYVCLFVAFALFIGCDICVGLSNLQNIGSNLIWLFYLPSQVLLALSILEVKRIDG